MATLSQTLPVAASRRRLSKRRIRWEILLFSLPALAVVIGLFIMPFLYGLDLSLHTLDSKGAVQDSRSIDNYTTFFNDQSQIDTVVMTFQVALPVTLFNVVISLPLAYAMRRGIRFERFITAMLILPITLGTVLVAQAMLIYFGRQGWFNQALQAIGLIHDPLRLVHNWIGVEIALFIQGFPFVFLMILGYMSGINPDLEKASKMLGAGRWRTFRTVILPLMLPGVAIAFCLNFVANFTVFPSAVLVGEPNALTRVLSIAAYRAAYEQQNTPYGTAIALIMGAIEFIVVVLVLYLRSRLARSASLGAGKGA